MRMPKWICKITSFGKAALNSLPDRIFDLLLGVSTREPVIGESTVFTGQENCPYEVSQWLPVRNALKDLEPGTADVFVDLGSGKGKALLIAGKLPFKHVIGVELDEKLSESARSNIGQAGGRLKASAVDCITASVLEWPIPDETSVVFMANPFIGHTFRSAIGRIIESYDRRPRTLHIVYLHPWEHDWLMSTGRVVVDNVRSGNWLLRPRWWQGGYVIISYRVVDRMPAGSQPSSFYRSSIRSRRAIQHWSTANGHCFTMSAPGADTIYSHS
jgi:SAM-dependent methyltransferase